MLTQRANLSDECFAVFMCRTYIADHLATGNFGRFYGRPMLSSGSPTTDNNDDDDDIGVYLIFDPPSFTSGIT